MLIVSHSGGSFVLALSPNIYDQGEQAAAALINLHVFSENDLEECFYLYLFGPISVKQQMSIVMFSSRTVSLSYRQREQVVFHRVNTTLALKRKSFTANRFSLKLGQEG